MHTISLKKNRLLTVIVFIVIFLLKFYLLNTNYFSNNIVLYNLIILFIIVFYALFSVLFFSTGAIIENFFIFMLFINPKIHYFITGTDYNSAYYQGVFKVHVSTVYIIVSFIFFLVIKTLIKHTAIIQKPKLIDILWIVYIAYISFLTIYFRGINGIPVIVDVYLSGYIAYLLYSLDKFTTNVEKLVSFLVSLLLINLAIGVSEILVNKNYLINSFLEYTSYEIENLGILRALGLTDHPLSFALLNILLLYTGYYYKKSLWQLLGLTGVFISYSRAAIILSILFYCIYNLLNIKNKRSLYKFIVTFACLLFLVYLMYPSLKIRNDYTTNR